MENNAYFPLMSLEHSDVSTSLEHLSWMIISIKGIENKNKKSGLSPVFYHLAHWMNSYWKATDIFHIKCVGMLGGIELCYLSSTHSGSMTNSLPFQFKGPEGTRIVHAKIGRVWFFTQHVMWSDDRLHFLATHDWIPSFLNGQLSDCFRTIKSNNVLHQSECSSLFRTTAVHIHLSWSLNNPFSLAPHSWQHYNRHQSNLLCR